MINCVDSLLTYVPVNDLFQIKSNDFFKAKVSYNEKDKFCMKPYKILEHLPNEPS